MPKGDSVARRRWGGACLAQRASPGRRTGHLPNDRRSPLLEASAAADRPLLVARCPAPARRSGGIRGGRSAPARRSPYSTSSKAAVGSRCILMLNHNMQNLVLLVIFLSVLFHANLLKSSCLTIIWLQFWILYEGLSFERRGLVISLTH
jgi:hypothetical protein